MKADRLPNLTSILFVCPYQNAHNPSDNYNRMIRRTCRVADVALLGCEKRGRGSQGEWLDYLNDVDEEEPWPAYIACLKGEL